MGRRRDGGGGHRGVKVALSGCVSLEPFWSHPHQNQHPQAHVCVYVNKEKKKKLQFLLKSFK